MSQVPAPRASLPWSSQRQFPHGRPTPPAALRAIKNKQQGSEWLRDGEPWHPGWWRREGSKCMSTVLVCVNKAIPAILARFKNQAESQRGETNQAIGSPTFPKSPILSIVDCFSSAIILMHSCRSATAIRAMEHDLVFLR